jgi:hypothetical protein
MSSLKPNLGAFLVVMLFAGRAAATCTYDVTPPPNVALGNGDVLTASMSAPAGCAWTVRTTVPWLAVSRTLGGGFDFIGSGSGSFFVHVGGTIGLGRSADVTVHDGSGATVATFSVSQGSPQFPSPASTPRPSDFDGDGKSDMTVWRPGSGIWYPIGSNDFFTSGSKSGVAPRAWGLGGLNDVPVSGDYDGDLQEDHAVWRPGTGIWYILQSTSNYTSFRSFHWGQAGDVPVPADYDGDGRTDIGIWRPSTGTWFILRSVFDYSLAQAVVRQWGLSTDRPVPADYDGDGMADMSVWRPATGDWWILRSWLLTSPAVLNAVAAFSVNWGHGLLSDVPVPADYDGDRAADPAVWRPGSGVWYALRSSMQLADYCAVPWGNGAYDDRPIVGDYDGDGVADLGIWRGTTGTWFVRTVQPFNAYLPHGGGFLFSTQWGSSALNDLPLPR